MMADKAPRAGQTRRKTAIQKNNETKILDAALDEFSITGFRGSTIDNIASAAGMSKPNLLYYYTGKEHIYTTLLDQLLHLWTDPLEEISAEGDPIEELRDYIHLKLEISRTHPRESRLLANEIIQGAHFVGEALAGYPTDLLKTKVTIIQQWVDEGRIAKIDPIHLIFAIWSTTQHYANFDSQVRTILGTKGDGHYEDAFKTLEAIFLDGLRVK